MEEQVNYTKEKIQELMVKINNRTPEEKKIIEQKRINELIEKFSKKKFQLKKWAPPKDSPNWSHDHCDFCFEHISDKEGSENEAYTDKEENDWICKKCFEKYKDLIEGEKIK